LRDPDDESVSSEDESENSDDEYRSADIDRFLADFLPWAFVRGFARRKSWLFCNKISSEKLSL